MFQLNKEELNSLGDSLRSQIVTANQGDDGVTQSYIMTDGEFKGSKSILRSQIVTANQQLSMSRFLPYAFTEQGMLEKRLLVLGN